MNNIEQIHYWDGLPIESLSHEELLAAFKELADIARIATDQANSSRQSAARVMLAAARHIGSQH